MADGAEEAFLCRNQRAHPPNHQRIREKEIECDQPETKKDSGKIGGFAEVHRWQSVVYS